MKLHQIEDDLEINLSTSFRPVASFVLKIQPDFGFLNFHLA